MKVEKLKDENVMKEFIEKLEEKFAQVNMNEASDIELEWSTFKNVILETVKSCCGTYVCKNESGRRKSEWWNDEIRNDENLEFYREQKRVVKMLVKEVRERDGRNLSKS